MTLEYRSSHNRITGFSLIVLTMGFLSVELDLLRDHAHIDAVSYKHCDRGDGRRGAHLTRNEYSKELPPCNACFFHSLLSHSLTPNSISLAVSVPSIQSSSIPYVCTAQSFLDHEGIRGPPLG
jgi:hypothetical protein